MSVIKKAFFIYQPATSIASELYWTKHHWASKTTLYATRKMWKSSTTMSTTQITASKRTPDETPDAMRKMPKSSITSVNKEAFSSQSTDQNSASRWPCLQQEKCQNINNNYSALRMNSNRMNGASALSLSGSSLEDKYPLWRHLCT